MTPVTVALLLTIIAQQPPAQPTGVPNPAEAQIAPVPTFTPAATDALRLQVMLDRAGFSPGAIDGNMGSNTRKALEAYTAQHGTPQPPAEALTRYEVSAEDVAGPFTPDIPPDLVQQAQLPALGYRSVLELLAERFHSTPGLLQRLNPGARFAAGEEILVPDVEPLQVPAGPPRDAAPSPAAAPSAGAPQARRQGTAGTSGAVDVMSRPEVVVTVSKSRSILVVKNTEGRVVMYAPVTTGSERDPLPLGEWKVNGVQINPPFRYNPDLFWDADPSDTKATLPPGPNNPVGLVWIDLSKEHYGIHGTPEPSAIGRSASHGCVRMTNWDALRLAALVKPGTKVVFTT